MSTRNRSFFSSVGRAFAGVGDTLAAAREMNQICNTPDSVFRSRGTTRDAAMRAIISRL